MTASLRTGVAGQLGFATNALHDPETIVTPDTFVPFITEAVADSLPTIRQRSIAANLFPRVEDVRPIDTGMATGAVTHALLNTGYARLLRHCFAGYEFFWLGSTNAEAILTLAANPTAGDTFTIGSQTYTMQTALTASTTANEILIGANAAGTASNIEAAINRGINSAGEGSGVVYGSLTPRNADVTATDNGDDTVTFADRQSRGTGGNSVATTETFTDVGNVFDNATLTGGVDGTDAANRHRYTFDGAAMFELLATLQIVRPPTSAARAAFTYVGKIVSFVMSFNETQPLQLAPTWDTISRTLLTAIASPSFPSDASWFDYTQIAVELDDVSEPVQGATLTVATGQASRAQAGTATRRRHLITGEPTITGELTREFENTDIYEAWIAGTEAKLEMLTTGGQIPSSATNYQVNLTAPNIRYLGSTPQVGGTGIVGNNIPFEVLEGAEEVVTLDYITSEGFVGDDGI